MGANINSTLSGLDIVNNIQNVDGVDDRLLVQLTNESNSLIVDYREIPGSDYPHGIVFSVGPFTEDEIRTNLPEDKIYYHSVVRAPTIAAALNFLISQLRQYLNLKNNGFIV